MGLADADSGENQSGSRHLVIWPVSCPVEDRKGGDPKLVRGQVVRPLPGTGFSEIVQRKEIVEEYFCNYEVNPAYEKEFESAGLIVAARGPHDEIRAVEIRDHRFFFATLFQPQRSSRPENPHPLIVSLVRAAALS